MMVWNDIICFVFLFNFIFLHFFRFLSDTHTQQLYDVKGNILNGYCFADKPETNDW